VALDLVRERACLGALPVSDSEDPALHARYRLQVVSNLVQVVIYKVVGSI
jgi:hypothetical protein